MLLCLFDGVLLVLVLMFLGRMCVDRWRLTRYVAQKAHIEPLARSLLDGQNAHADLFLEKVEDFAGKEHMLSVELRRELE